MRQPRAKHVQLTSEKKEMDDVVKFMWPDRAPGPHGFNGLFLKNC
jgi:hypothetical protein